MGRFSMLKILIFHVIIVCRLGETHNREAGHNSEIEECCDTLEVAVSPDVDALLASQTAVLNCTCTCKGKGNSSCPGIYVAPEAKGLINFAGLTVHSATNSCTVEWTITAGLFFLRRRVEAPISCLGINKKEEKTIVFEKHTNGGNCVEDIDCWSLDQRCNNKVCSCYDDTPSFIKDTFHCLPDAGYGEMCEHTEQCVTRDTNSLCHEKYCECKSGFSFKDGATNKCSEISGAFTSSPNHILTFATATLILYVRFFN